MEDKKISSVAFGLVLQELRIAGGLTQDALAELAGTERSHISALERAEKGPALATLFKLATALNISASELIGLVERKIQQKKLSR
jgi:transcriptional regulator with XRE-family HTH domain